MTRDDLNSIVRLAGIKNNIVETEGWSQPPQENPGVLRSTDGTPVKNTSGLEWSAGSQPSTNPPTKDQNIPVFFIPTHYHKTNIGKDIQLMMTEPGVFWHQVPNRKWDSNKETENPYLIKRFLPPEYSSASWDDLIKVTRPGLDNRLSVDGEIDTDGKIWAYDKRTDWFNAWKSEKTKWNPEIIKHGAYEFPPSAPWQEPAQTGSATIGSNKPETASGKISTQPFSSPEINIQGGSGSDMSGNVSHRDAIAASDRAYYERQARYAVEVGKIGQETFYRVRYLMKKRNSSN